MYSFVIPSIAPECGIDSFQYECGGHMSGRKIFYGRSSDISKMAPFLCTMNKEKSPANILLQHSLSTFDHEPFPS